MTIKYFIYALVFGITILLSFTVANAAPTTGDATSITSNNFTVSTTGASGDTWISWGQNPNGLSWGSQIESSPASIVVEGAPIIGGSTIYYQACDTSGCGAMKSLVVPAITPLTTPNFGAAYRNLSAHRFGITWIPAQLPAGYIVGGVPWILLTSIIFFCVFWGFFFRTRSVRMVLVMGILLAPFIVSATSGLFLGIILSWQQVAVMLVPACLAGILVGFIMR